MRAVDGKQKIYLEWPNSWMSVILAKCGSFVVLLDLPKLSFNQMPETIFMVNQNSHHNLHFLGDLYMGKP